MNIVRTKAVELSSIPAIAYKQKLASGGAGIKILRADGQTAVCTIDKRSSDMVPYGIIDEALFPMEAFDEAFELTNSLPYSARGNIKVVEIEEVQPDDVIEEAPAEQLDMTLSPEYQAIVERYSDEKGELNYALMNKDFIQFAARSKVVASMLGESASTDDIVVAIVKSRATEISRQKESLDDTSVLLLIESLDEMNPRSAFKELKAHINRMQARGKRRR
jgi:predicted Zn-dependent protease with MMP-like domain